MDSPDSKHDARWLDEYAKRKLLSSIWAAISNAYLWGIAATAGEMAIKKANGDSIDYHPTKTPAAIAGITLLGIGISAITQDQITHVTRLQKQRLARRISVPEKDSQPSTKSEEKVKWSEILRPTWMGGSLSGQDVAFEKKWYDEYFFSRNKRSYTGAITFGSFTAALTFYTSKLTKLAADKNATYHKLRTPAVAAAMLGVGSLTLYERTRQESRQELLEDNYLAQLITQSQKQGVKVASADIALAVNTGEPVQNPKANQTAQANKKWLKAYHKEFLQFSFLDEIGKATFLGMFVTFSAMLLDKAAGKEVKYHKTRSPLVFAGLMSFGCIATYWSRFKESHCVKMKDDRLAVYLHNKSEETPPITAIPKSQADSHYWQNRIAASAKMPSYSLAI